MEDNKYKQDVADPNVNVSGLRNIFECADTGDLINTSTGEIINPSDALAEVKEMRKEIKQIEDDMPDIDGIILKNIDRANNVLDKVEDQILAGNMSGTMLEACASLLNVVTSAATSITGISYNNDIVEIRKEELRIREKKVMMDSIKGTGKIEGDVHITNNTLTMTREELLDELRSDG